MRLLVLAAVLFLLSGHVPLTTPDTGHLQSAVLPTPSYGSMAAWDGTHAYVVGGSSSSTTSLSTILRYNPTADSLTPLSVSLPAGRDASCVAIHNGDLYVVGGKNGYERDPASYTTAIYRVSLVNDSVATIPATLPMAVADAGCAVIGTDLYILGGRVSLTYNSYIALATIQKFSLETVTATAMAATLPNPVASPGTAWVAEGGAIYMIGGFSESGPKNYVVSYDPNAGTVSSHPALSAPTYGAPAFADNEYVYMLGGWTPGNPDQTSNEVRRYSTTLGTIESMAGKLPSRVFYAGGVWAGTAALTFGGLPSYGVVVRLDDIFKWTPERGAPTTLTISLLPGA